MLDRIAAFTGIPVSEEVLEAVAVKMLGKPEAKHVGGRNETTATSSTEYYLTVRPVGHRHNRWHSRLGEEQVETLQCGAYFSVIWI